MVSDVWYVLFVISLEPFYCFEECMWIVVVRRVLEIYVLYNLVPGVCFLLKIFFRDFASNIFEPVSVGSCGAVVFDVLVNDFVLMLKEFDGVSWGNAGGVAVFEDGYVIVCGSVDFGVEVRD